MLEVFILSKTCVPVSSLYLTCVPVSYLLCCMSEQGVLPTNMCEQFEELIEQQVNDNYRDNMMLYKSRVTQVVCRHNLIFFFLLLIKHN